MDKYLQKKNITNLESRRNTTPDSIECSESNEDSAGSKQDSLEHPWPHLTKYFGPVKTKNKYTEGNRVMYKGRIECTQCKKDFSFDTKTTFSLKQHYNYVSNY